MKEKKITKNKENEFSVATSFSSRRTLQRYFVLEQITITLNLTDIVTVEKKNSKQKKGLEVRKM